MKYSEEKRKRTLGMEDLERIAGGYEHGKSDIEILYREFKRLLMAKRRIGELE